MALKPTIYKANISLSDIDRHYYDELSLTLAQHPSETLERMMVRLLVFCLNAHEDLSFTRGLSSTDEPDLWQRSMDGQIEHWIEVGQPDPDRVKKASNQSKKVSVYIFGKSAETWWQLNGATVLALPKTCAYQFQWEHIQALLPLVSRTMDLSVSITENTLYVSAQEQTVEVELRELSI